MFLGVVGRPRRNDHQNVDFSEKIGIYPLAEQVQAQGNSQNRAAGTMVTKNVEVTKERYKKMVIDRVIPDIRASFPTPLLTPAGKTGFGCSKTTPAPT